MYEKGEKPSLMISPLEAMKVLLATKLLYGDTLPTHGTSVQVASSWTGNRGSGTALNKLVSTRGPSSAVLVELAGHPKKMKMKVMIQ